MANYSYNWDARLAGYLLYGPDGSQGPGPTYGGGGDAEIFEIPLSNLASNIFNTSIPVNDFNLADILALLTRTGPYSLIIGAGTESGQIQVWNTYMGTCNTYCSDGGSNTNNVLALDYTAIGNSWNSLYHSSAREQIQFIGGDNQGCPCDPVYHEGKNIFYQGVLTALYTSSDNLSAFDFCNAETMLSQAPSDGPFTHSSTDFAPNGWASDRRFINQDSACVGELNEHGATVQWPGNYNGLDYMLMYNLYSLCSQMEFSNTMTVPTGCLFPFLYPPSIQGCNSYPPTLGAQSNPFNIVSYYCSPVIVNALDVTSTGGLTIQGGNTSYIDIKPTPGPIIVEPGGFFDAYCTYNCCDVNPAIYLNEYNYHSIQFNSPVHGNSDTNKLFTGSNSLPGYSIPSLPTYQKTLEFDTVFLNDGISCYPNPFNTQTTIAFSLKHDVQVSIYLTDMNGKKVTDIVKNENFSYGIHQLNYIANSLAAGTYICIFDYAKNKKTLKIIKD